MHSFQFENGEVMFTPQPVDPNLSLPIIHPLEMKDLSKIMTNEDIEALVAFPIHRRRYFWQRLKEKYGIGIAIFMTDINGNAIHYDVIEWRDHPLGHAEFHVHQESGSTL